MDNLKGSAIMVLAMALFAVTDALIKALSSDLSTGQILLVYSAFGLIVLLGLNWSRGARVDWAQMAHPAVIIRNVFEVLGTLSFVTALSLIPLATASAFIQATPLMLTLGAALLFREAVGWRRWTAILLGFVGVLLILRPGSDSFDPNTVFALLGVLCLAGRDLASRRVPARIESRDLVIFAFVVLIPTTTALMLLQDRGWTPPDGPQTALLIGMGVIGVAAYFAVTVASRMGDVSVVAPFRYTRLPFALFIGYFAFAERPDAMMLAGATLIVICGLYTLIREGRVRRQKV